MAERGRPRRVCELPRTLGPDRTEDGPKRRQVIEHVSASAGPGLRDEPIQAFRCAQFLRAHVHHQVLQRLAADAVVVKVGEELDGLLAESVDLAEEDTLQLA